MGWFFKNKCPACEGRKKVGVHVPADNSPCGRGHESYTREEWCSTCHGDGEVDFDYKYHERIIRTDCSNCGGKGKVVIVSVDRYPDGTPRPGTRKEKTETCKRCDGKGRFERKVKEWEQV